MTWTKLVQVITCNNTPLQECLVCLSWQSRKERNLYQIWVCSLCFMINWRMMLGTVIYFIFWSRRPIIPELFLGLSVSEPPQFHVWIFGCFVDYCFVCESHCCLIIRLNGCLRLWTSHFYECIAKWYHLFCCDKKCRHFCFFCQRHCCFYYLRNC